jgi:aspartate/methionine/tyrosine aminotransferase
MAFAVNPLLAAVAAPPIAEAQAWIKGRSFPEAKPLIDLAQAVPGYPPPKSLTDHLAEIVGRPETARYTEIEGLAALRSALAADIGAAYGATVAADRVVVTAGCNQAFCLALMALAKAGDEAILPLPYYFNHQMWLDMLGVRAVHLGFRPEAAGVPDPEEAAAKITPRTRAILLVTPNNPTGAVYPPGTIRAFYALAKRRGLALVVDETYRDFLPNDAPPHDLFADPDWPETLVHLYSFSKVFSLTGYRVGAVLCGAALRAEIAKAMDCVAICAPHVGQAAALYGLAHLSPWRRQNTAMMRERLTALRAALARNDLGFELVSSGAYFAYLRHPFDGETATSVARGLAERENLLCLPGGMFGPRQNRFLRLAFANVAAERMPEVAARLAAASAGANR